MLSIVKTKTTVEVDGIYLTVSEGELDLIKTALGNFKFDEAEQLGFPKLLVSNVYNAILEAQKKVGECK